MDQTSSPQTDLLAEIEAHCAATGLSKSAFGHKAVGDPRFVFDLEAGRDCRWSTVKRIRKFMEDCSSSVKSAPTSDAAQ